ASQAKIRVALHQEFPVHRAMRVLTNLAAFAHSSVLDHEWPSLLAMTLRAVLIEAGNRQPSGGLEILTPMRFVALNAIHLPLDNWMMLRHSKFRLRLQMTLKTRARILSRINDELSPPSAGFHMLAPRPVARFTTGLPDELRVFDVHTSMRARRK